MTSVYVIEAQGGPVKIGIARCPQSRLRALRTGTPFRLRLAFVEDPGDLNAARVEKVAHELLAASRTHGEWFCVTANEAREAILKAEEYLRSPPISPSRKSNNYPIETNTFKIIDKFVADGAKVKVGSKYFKVYYASRSRPSLFIPRQHAVEPIMAKSIARAAGWI